MARTASRSCTCTPTSTAGFLALVALVALAGLWNSALASAWFVAGAVLGVNAEAAAEAQNQLVGLIGLLVLAAVTAVEAGLAVKRVRPNG